MTKESKEAKVPLEFEEVAPHGGGPYTAVSNKFPLHDSNGAVNAVCGISTDITERKHAEAELQKQQICLRNVIDVNPNCLFIKDRGGRVDHWRGSKTGGRT